MKTWMLAVVVMLSGGMASGAEVRLYAEDGTYLGKAGASRFDPESIDNPFGEYGSKFSPTSINNRFSPYWRGNVGSIPRPAESSMDGFWRGYQQGYDSTARLAQQRREYAAENERWLRERQEQRARDAERAAIEEQTREIRALREELEDQRYELEAQRYQQQAAQAVSPRPETPKEKEIREAADRNFAKRLREGGPARHFSAEFFEEMGWPESAAAQREVTAARETEEEKAARLKEEGRREWEEIKLQWAAEDARQGK